MATPEVRVKISAENDTDKGLHSAQSSLGGYVNAATSLLKGLAATAAAAAIGKFLKDSIEEATAAERGMARLGVAVSNTGQNFSKFAPEIENVVSGIVKLTKYTDDDLRAALTTLITTSGDTQGSLKNLTAVTDLAAGRQIDLESAALLVGKAMNGNTMGLNKLGIAGKDADTVMENLRGTFRGFAEKEGATFSGTLTRINNQWGEFKEAVGTAILGGDTASEMANNLVQRIANLTGWVEQNADSITALTKVIGGVVSAFGWFVGKLIEVEGAYIRHGRIGPAFWVDLFGGGPKEVKKKADETTKIVITENGNLVQMIKERDAELLRNSKEAHEERLKLEKKAADERKRIEKQAADDREALHRIELSKAGLLLSDASLKLKEHTKVAAADWERLRKDAEAGKNTLLGVPPISPTVALSLHLAAIEAENLGGKLPPLTEEQKKAKWSGDDLARSMLDIAMSTGAVSREAGSAIGSIINLGSALASIGVDPIGGMIGVISGLASVITGFANNPAHKAMLAMVASNREALAKNTLELGNFNLGSSGKTFTATQGALEAAREASAKSYGLTGPAETLARASNARKAFIDSLLKQGVSLPDALELLKSIGVEGFNSKSAGEQLQFFKGARENLGEVEFGKFDPNSFDDQLKALTESFSIFGVEDADDKLSQFRDLVAKFSPALGRALDVDLNTAEGRAAATKNLQELFNKLRSGGLSATEIGVSGQQFLALIQSILPLLSGADGAGTIPAAGRISGGALGFAPGLGGASVDGLSSGGGFGGSNYTVYVTQSAGEDGESFAVRVAQILGAKYTLQRESQGLT